MSAQKSPSASMLQRIDFSRLHVDIDAFLNPYLPPPPWHHLPQPISRFFGYRKTLAPKPLGNLVIAFWSMIGVFCGVLVVAEVSEHIPSFQAHHAPIIVASFVRTSWYPRLHYYYSMWTNHLIGCCCCLGILRHRIALCPTPQCRSESDYC